MKSDWLAAINMCFNIWASAAKASDDALSVDTWATRQMQVIASWVAESCAGECDDGGAKQARRGHGEIQVGARHPKGPGGRVAEARR